MQRRRFIGGLAAAAAAGLAGCGASSASKRPPNVPEQRLEEGGWVQTDQISRRLFERQVAGQTLTADGVTLLYEDRALAEELNRKSLGQVQGTLAQFFATRVVTDPNLAGLPGGIGRDEIVAQVTDQAAGNFETRLSEAGLSEVQQTGTTEMPVATGETATRTDYRATFPVESMSFPVTENQSVTIEGADLQVDAHLAVWIHDSAIYVAGGAYPGQNFARDVDKQLSEAINVSVSVDMGMTPDAYREEVLGLVKNVS